MPLDWRPEEELAKEQFPQLLTALEAAEKLLKKIRRFRNQGRANDTDVEHVRQARDLLRNVLDAANWRQHDER